MRALNRLQVTIEPTNYDSLAVSFTAITVTVVVDGQKYSYRREVIPDHLTSLFDNVFEEAKEQIKRVILEEGEKVRSG